MNRYQRIHQQTSAAGWLFARWAGAVAGAIVVAHLTSQLLLASAAGACLVVLAAVWYLKDTAGYWRPIGVEPDRVLDIDGDPDDDEPKDHPAPQPAPVEGEPVRLRLVKEGDAA